MWIFIIIIFGVITFLFLANGKENNDGFYSTLKRAQNFKPKPRKPEQEYTGVVISKNIKHSSMLMPVGRMLVPNQSRKYLIGVKCKEGVVNLDVSSSTYHSLTEGDTYTFYQ